MVEFKTSFIPKKPTPAKGKIGRGRGLGVLGFIAFIVFLLSLVISGGLYLYKVILERNIENMSQSIDRVKEAIEPQLIENLANTDLRIETSQLLLNDHIIVSPVFRILEDLTLKTVRFNAFSFSISEDGEIELLLTGEAKNYSSLALQSDVFGDEDAMMEPIFSNLNLNDQGNVSFSFGTPIKRSLVLYKNNLNVIPRFIEQETDSGDFSEENGLDIDDLENLGSLDEELDDLLNEFNF